MKLFLYNNEDIQSVFLSWTLKFFYMKNNFLILLSFLQILSFVFSGCKKAKPIVEENVKEIVYSDRVYIGSRKAREIFNMGFGNFDTTEYVYNDTINIHFAKEYLECSSNRFIEGVGKNWKIYGFYEGVRSGFIEFSFQASYKFEEPNKFWLYVYIPDNDVQYQSEFEGFLQ